jgi:glucosamine-6-phosphate isomerase
MAWNWFIIYAFWLIFRWSYLWAVQIKQMEIFIGDTYEIMSRRALDDILAITQGLKHPVLCTASGDTPAGLYRELVQAELVKAGSPVNRKRIDVSSWYFVGLDEWVGMNGHNEGSCRFHLNNQLFYPLGVAEEKIVFFDGTKKDLDGECEHVENFIQKCGGIDIAILGLGINGHVGMNEPGTSPALRSHVTAIDSQTQETGQKYFKEKQQLTKGITLGLATIMEARKIMLLVSGLHKAKTTQRALEGEISEQFPASLLRRHGGLSVYLDKEAGGLLTSHE